MPSALPYRLLGGPGSPYSLKLRAVLRYRRLPHLWIVPQGYLGSEGELAQAGKKLIPVLQLPEDGSYWADSTPIIYALEQRHPQQRSVMAPDPADAFLAHLIEDFADELLVLAMFAYRWSGPADLAFCPRRQLSVELGDGLQCTGRTNPYTANCLLWLKHEYASLDEAARARVDAALGGGNANAWLQWRTGEAEHMPPHRPR